MNCIFCKLANKELPASIIDESENTLTFLDVNPVADGHCLVITKKHFQDTQHTPDKILLEVITQAKKQEIY